MKVHVFGDTGGHWEQLFAGLVADCLMDPETYVLPKDVMIIHVGDLIHKGPHSLEVLQLVEKVRQVNPGQWVQIIGNHEANYIHGAPHFWDAHVPLEGQKIIQRWLQEGFLQFAYALPTFQTIPNLEVTQKPKTVVPSKSILFTHAGLSFYFWKRTLGSPSDAVETADRVNALPVDVVTQAGSMLYGPGRVKNNQAGPVWAQFTNEVFASWVDLDVPMPFIQFHGHNAPFSFVRNSWWPSTPLLYRKAAKTNPEVRSTHVAVAESLLVSVDPGYSDKAYSSKQGSTVILV